ncbi:hypothetical protein TRFO_17980 [Tritrichomonas foetus]|uniref:FUZ/MON1/HPS1 first Longin domain-containing protein n=1 Tax=Tritrichomonas foetus TaxID=1144522 RepID=A0A1J4KS38_9EUKA|nr:hypothetical protein TRFO_17980 [Tritrichomonas foetus]|eukprot:OHT12285.1 hypothetical protein TRFO_17980 [Tritrichomonas foetus]
MNLDTKVRVISDTTTFYPVEKDGEESHHRNDNMSLRTTLVYLHEQMGEDFQFFTADDLFVVLQQWRGMLFFIQTNNARFQEVMRLQLQTIREILIFLFGTKFESVMKRSISMDKRKVFSQYVDNYLALCQEDYVYLLNAMRVDSDSKEMSDFFLKVVSSIAPDFDINMLNVILFNKNKIVARYDAPNAVKVDPETFLTLSVFERVEYSELDNQISDDIQKNNKFDASFVESPNNSSMKHKNAFLRIERTPVACLLSSSRLGESSPFVILVATQNMKISEEMRQLIMKFISAVTSQLMKFVVPQPEPQPIQVMEELIHYILIDRTHGNVWELPLDLSTGFLMDYLHIDDEDEAIEKMQKLTQQMAAYGMSAMMRGYTTMMWGEQDFQFCYELRFEDEDHEILKPTHVFSPPPFNDDNGINYRLITNSLFPNDEGITCLELLSVYQGKVQVKTVMQANETLFDIYRQTHT